MMWSKVMQRSFGVNQRTIIAQKCLRLRPPNVSLALEQKKTFNLARSIIAYFVKALIMPIGALVDAKISNFNIFKSAL